MQPWIESFGNSGPLHSLLEHGEEWDKQEPKGLEPTIDCFMLLRKGRFDDIKRHTSHIFADCHAETTDPWWQIADGIDRFHKNRKDGVLSGLLYQGHGQTDVSLQKTILPSHR